MNWTHPIRIYRPGFEQKHDLTPEMITRDIYNEDVWGRLMPDSESIVVPNDYGFTAASATVAFPKDVDVSVGYVIFVGAPRVRDGHREMTETELSEDRLVGQTIFPVDYSAGFLPGQEISVEDESNTHYAKVEEVSRREITVYPEDKLTNDFDAGTPVRAGTYYMIKGRRYPSDFGTIQLVQVTEVAGGVE